MAVASEAAWNHVKAVLGLTATGKLPALSGPCLDGDGSSTLGGCGRERHTLCTVCRVVHGSVVVTTAL